MAGPITITSGTVDGVNAVFVLASAVVNQRVVLDRLEQDPRTDYTLVGTTLTFLPGAIPNPFVGGTPDAASLHIAVYGDIVGVTSATAPTVSKTGYATAGNIINRVAVQVGLSAVADPFASTDPVFVQLCELLNMMGEDLQNQHEWGSLIRETTITTSASATSYAMPADFDRLIDDTEWNRSTRFSLVGPLTGPEVQYLKARLSGVLIQVAFRLQANVMTFALAPPDNQTIAFEYVSDYWAWSAAGQQPDKSLATASTDTILYPQDLMIAAVKWAWLDTKGFDTSSAAEKLQSILESSKSKNTAARTLNLGGIGVNPDHLIDAENLPITGYAQ